MKPSELRAKLITFFMDEFRLFPFQGSELEIRKYEELVDRLMPIISQEIVNTKIELLERFEEACKKAEIL